MDAAHWQQSLGLVKPMEEMLMAANAGAAASTGQGSNPNQPAPPSVAGGGAPAPPAMAGAGSTERHAGPQKEKALNCPRCNSTNFMFCNYNYILQQPRYFCKTCRRFWTEGGSLRNVPVGGGSRKNNRSSSSASASTSASVTSSSMASTAGAASKNPKLAHEGAQDLNLAFPHHSGLHAPEFAAIPSLESSHEYGAPATPAGPSGEIPSPSSAESSGGGGPLRRYRVRWRPWGMWAAEIRAHKAAEALQSLELNAQMRMLAAAGASPAPSLLAQGPLDTAASSSAPLAIVSVGMDSHPSEAAGYERQELTMHSPSSSGTRNLHNLLPQEQQLVVAPPHFITRNGGGPPDFIELLAQCLWCEYLRSQQRPDCDLEAGGQAHRVGGGAAAPVQQPPEVGAVMVQALAALLPTCVTAYPVLKDAPDYIKLTIFVGLAFTTLGLFIGTLLSNSVARRGLAIRLVSFSAIAVLTFCTASQFSSRIYVALTALIGVVLNLIIMLLQF